MQGVRRAAIVRPMTLEQLSALAQIVGAGALLASLIFVGLQIRQNTQSQRVVAVESLAAAIAAINVPAMQSPALGTALATALKDWSLASHDERVIAHYFLFCFFKLHEQAWYQYRSRVLDDAQWAAWNRPANAFKNLSQQFVNAGATSTIRAHVHEVRRRFAREWLLLSHFLKNESQTSPPSS
jgi:hypothetical protein